MDKKTKKPTSKMPPEARAAAEPLPPAMIKRGEQGADAMRKRQMNQLGDFRQGLGIASPPSYKKGGKVNKGGMAKVHKGEVVLTKKQAAKPAIKKAIKKK